MAFTAYNVSDDQLLGLTRLAYQEQGDDVGAAAEASLMCNLFELRKGGGTATDLYNYVRNSTWFANSKSIMAGNSGNTKNPSADQLANIRAVLNGGRTIPGYVDEHDYIGDIDYIENGRNGSTSKSDRSVYVPHETIIHNHMESTYYFYCFPTPTSDPFGYTSKANRDRIGDEVAGGGSSAGGSSGGSSGVATPYQTTPKVYETATTITGNGEDNWKKFYKLNMTSPSFISQCLTPYARSAKTGMAGYRLWFEDTSPDSKKRTTVHFQPDNFNQMNNASLLEGLDKHYEFEWGTGASSNVIDFNPGVVSADIVGASGGQIDATALNAITNEYVGTTFNRFTDTKRPSTGSTSPIDPTDEAKVVMLVSSYSASELNNMAAELWYNSRILGYTADLTIVGDPELDVQSICTVMAFNPGNGMPHHTSGIYLINEITDTIEGGQFTSQLTLQRNAMEFAANESGGLEIQIGGATTWAGEESVSSAGSSGTSTSTSASNSGGSGVAADASVEKAVLWALQIASDESHGYDQDSRNGPDYDCSSLVYHAFKQAGFNVMGGDCAGNTNSMRSDFERLGFKWHPELAHTGNLERGDILLNENHHVEIYIGGGQMVGARHNERPSGSGSSRYHAGQKGDQTGEEICTKEWADYPWDGVLRYQK